MVFLTLNFDSQKIAVNLNNVLAIIENNGKADIYLQGREIPLQVDSYQTIINLIRDSEGAEVI